MGRKKQAKRRDVQPDFRYNSTQITDFVAKILKDGKRSTAENIIYDAFDIIKSRTSEDGMKIFKKAVESVTPMLEVKSRRIGGANYQVPVEVKPSRGESLAQRWIVEAARERTEHSMEERLANELLEASNGRGGAAKKREDVHRMAEANKAFAHFRW
jgi:small subunit ribosomal protein S7